MKKVFTTILVIITVLILIFGISLIIQKKAGKVPYLFGYTYFLNTGKSMLKEIEPGDLLIIHRQDNYEINDIITYEDFEGNIVTHRIIGNNEDGYLMKGDNNSFIDEKRIPKERVYGKVVKNLFNAKTLVNNFNANDKIIIGGSFIIIAFIGLCILVRKLCMPKL